MRKNLVPTLLTTLGLVVAIGCTPAPVRSPDAQVDELIIKCKARQPLAAKPQQYGADTNTLSREMAEQSYQAALNPLRSPEGLAALEQRTRSALEPISQFCTLEALVRTDPDRARKVWAELQNNPNLAYFVLRDEYMKEALKPYPDTPVR